MKLLEELYHGNLSGMENYLRTDGDLAKAMGKVETLRESLQGELTADQRKRLDELLESMERRSSIEVENAFVKGWRLGVIIMLETLYSQ